MNWLRKQFNKIFNRKKYKTATLDKILHNITILMIMKSFRDIQKEVRGNVYNSTNANVRRNVRFGMLKSTSYSDSQLENAYNILETL